MVTEAGIEDRRLKVAEIISHQGFVSLVEIVQNLGISGSTVRRDLEALEDQGLIRRTHGGAIWVSGATGRPALADRDVPMLPQKQMIARTVASLVPQGQTVILSGGTTCYQVARMLQGRRLNVITNSVQIGSLLTSDMGTEVTMLGGTVYPRIGVTLGTMTERQLDSMHASQLVLSCAGVTQDGAFEPNQMMVDVERKMMQTVDRAILAVDHTKFGMRAVFKLCQLDELDVIVADAQTPEEARKWLSSVAAKVVFAE